MADIRTCIVWHSRRSLVFFLRFCPRTLLSHAPSSWTVFTCSSLVHPHHLFSLSDLFYLSSPPGSIFYLVLLWCMYLSLVDVMWIIPVCSCDLFCLLNHFSSPPVHQWLVTQKQNHTQVTSINVSNGWLTSGTIEGILKAKLAKETGS